jgi:multicomponent Na+:H+ antiporter subunit B
MITYLEPLVVSLLLTLLAVTAVIIVRMRSLFAAAMLTGIYSFLGASWMFVLDAPDVAFTEAAVGAGIATILMLSTLALTGRRGRSTTRKPWIPLAVVTVTGAALIYGTLDMPHVGNPDAPIHRYPSPSYIERTEEDIHIPNVVTAVLGSYRGYDTFGETTVIFTAAVGVMLLLRDRRSRRERRKGS